MIQVYFDGACGPINPGGLASYGWLIKENGKVIAKGDGIVGEGQGMTNNVAEYNGLKFALIKLKELGIKGKVEIFGDSNMVCNVVSKTWGWNKKRTVWNPHDKKPHLRTLLDEVLQLLEGYEYTIKWVAREENSEADDLSKKNQKEMDQSDMVASASGCDKCNGKMLKRKGKFGEFLGCSNYPKCKNTKAIAVI